MSQWINLSKIGHSKEQEFADLLVKSLGGVCKKSTKQQDMYDHIDLIWLGDSRLVTFDVKSAKKSNRSDNLPDYNIHWVELQNVKGNPGWLYGKAAFIAFETLNDWLIIRRTKIIDLINSKVTNKSISKSKDLYTYYQRNGRQDIVVKVLTDDLRKIANKCLTKL